MSLGVDFEAAAARKKLAEIGRVVLVGSGKGGVGKTVVSCGLALSLAGMKKRVGLLDIDVHGASVPSYLGLRPPLRTSGMGIAPLRKGRVAVMSLALFTGDNPIPVRGEKKRALLTQLFARTGWGKLDYLVVDLPPGTGDELLAALAIFGTKAEMVLVTTPSRGALGVVGRLRKLVDSERVPVVGSVVNMAYSQDGRKRTYPFGRPDRPEIQKELGAPIIAELPLEPRVSSLGLVKVLTGRGRLGKEMVVLGNMVARMPER